MQQNVFQYKKVRIYYSNYPTCDWFLCPVRRDVHKICALQSRKDARNTHTRSQFEEERRVLLLRYLPSMFVAAVYIATRIMSTVSTPVTTKRGIQFREERYNNFLVHPDAKEDFRTLLTPSVETAK